MDTQNLGFRIECSTHPESQLRAIQIYAPDSDGRGSLVAVMKYDDDTPPFILSNGSSDSPDRARQRAGAFWTASVIADNFERWFEVESGNEPEAELLTHASREAIEVLAERSGLTKAEFLERSLHWLAEHWDSQLRREIGA